MHTIPGTGTVHHYETRRGHRLGVLIDHEGHRTLMIYNGEDPDSPRHTIELDRDEADQLAQLLQDPPIVDRITKLERRLAALEKRLTSQRR